MGTASEQVHRFVERIPRVRNARSMTQQELAAAAGLTRQALGKIEARRQGVGLDDALAICDALNVSIEAMVSSAPLTLIVRVPID